MMTEIPEAFHGVAGAAQQQVPKRQSSTKQSNAATMAIKRWMSCDIIFYAQLILVSVLTLVLIARGFLLDHSSHHFYPMKWFLPILTATGAAGISTSAWLCLVHCCPSRLLEAAFWISPIFSIAAAVMFICIESLPSLILGLILILFALGQACYGCWVNRQFQYSNSIIKQSTEDVPPKVHLLIGLTIVSTVLYSSFLLCGIGGASVVMSAFDIGFIAIIVLSLTWTMNIAKNSIQILVGQVKYEEFTSGGLNSIEPRSAFLDILNHKMRNIALGSVLLPISGLIRGSARAITSISGSSDEVCCSCTECYSGVAKVLTRRANRWGLVHVGSHSKDFSQASSDTLESFYQSEMNLVIDSDLTGVFCFFCGMANAAVSALVAGSWAIAVHRSYAVELSVYAFLIGYFTCRIAMAWPEGSVAAYYVSFVDDPQSGHLYSIVRSRIEQLKLHQQLAQSRS